MKKKANRTKPIPLTFYVTEKDAETFEENFEHSEIICVNDSSLDKSVDVISSLVL